MRGGTGVRRYRFLGLHLAVSGTAALVEALHTRLRHFPVDDAQAADLDFEFITLDSRALDNVTRPAGDARPVAPPRDDGFQVEYFGEDDLLYINYRDKVRALCDARRSTVRVSVVDPEAKNLWTATRPVFVLSLFELLKRRGYFNVHASGVAIGDRVLLLPGHSGAGKTTLAAALCRAGFAFMADDYVFLTRRSRGLRVMAFPEELEVLDGTRILIPELEPCLHTADPSGWPKRQVRADECSQTGLTWEGSAAVLVFPTVAHKQTSRISPMDASDALSHLVANIQFTRPELAQEHIDIFGALVRSCACYRLETGRDLASLAVALRGLVDSSECVMDVPR